MKEYLITEAVAGQRIDRFLNKLMPLAGKNFLQKMLRKKNIKLNGQKADAAAMLKPDDTVQVYFSDETIVHFQKETSDCDIPQDILPIFTHPVYEDETLLVVNKPAGLLTQRADQDELSLIDYARTFIQGSTDTFQPAVCNRLDRNTSGVVIIPKDYPTLRDINAAIRERKVTKRYLTIVSGRVREPLHLDNYLSKDTDKNQMHLSEAQDSKKQQALLEARPLCASKDYTLLEVQLFTGRTHQIRVQLAEIGHPLIGDYKYGDAQTNAYFKQHFGLKHQLLHSHTYLFKDPAYTLIAPPPERFLTIAKALHLEKGLR